MNSLPIFSLLLSALAGFVVFAAVRFSLLFIGGVAGGGGGQDTRVRDLLILAAVTALVCGGLALWVATSAAISAFLGSALAALWLVPKMRSGRGGRR
jgi:membrane associated rhomboid family serine protease